MVKRKDTKTRLLDVAEEMFAQKGYADTSMRSLTGKAGANLAAVNYHFGSKEGLLQAVLERRLLPLNHIRRGRLEATMRGASEAGRLPDVRDLLRAFIEPTLILRRSGRGSRAFIIVISRGLSEPDPMVRATFVKLVLPILQYFNECLAVALPQLPPRELFYRFHFCMGAMAHVLHGMDKKEFFCPDMAQDDMETVLDMMLHFLAAGMESSALPGISAGTSCVWPGQEQALPGHHDQ
ncbi:MAG: hypothetical protein BWK76_02820 [Desulfobulbaceae bacterium A2]|nr:MAG: hypothetical protein BWK76_02820 [Desulfobulbaceae bacterium A2]